MTLFFIDNTEKIRDLLNSFGFNPFSYRTDKYVLIHLDFEAMEYSGLKSKVPSYIRVYPEQIADMVLLGSYELRKLYAENYRK